LIEVFGARKSSLANVPSWRLAPAWSAALAASEAPEKRMNKVSLVAAKRITGLRE
jgi:hypothetical protein